MFAVCVTFQIKAEHLDAFLPLMMANARASVADEAECHQFDVCQSEATPTEFFLYELYTNAEAFQAHLETSHFLAFDAAVKDMLAEKSVKTYNLLNLSIMRNT